MKLNWQYLIHQRKVRVVRVVAFVLHTNLNKGIESVLCFARFWASERILGGKRKKDFKRQTVLEPHNSHFKRGYHLLPPLRQGKFLLIVLTVFNEQCLRMYISLTEFVITSSGYWLQLMLTLILKAAAQYDNMNLVINIRAGINDWRQQDPFLCVIICWVTSLLTCFLRLKLNVATYFSCDCWGLATWHKYISFLPIAAWHG